MAIRAKKRGRPRREIPGEKLNLLINPVTKMRASRLADERHISIGRLFEGLILAMDDGDPRRRISVKRRRLRKVLLK
jgi:hypothetical protein